MGLPENSKAQFGRSSNFKSPFEGLPRGRQGQLCGHQHRLLDGRRLCCSLWSQLVERPASWETIERRRGHSSSCAYKVGMEYVSGSL